MCYGTPARADTIFVPTKHINIMTINDLMQQASTSVIDVREPYEYASGHIEGAINIPLGEVPMRQKEICQLSKPIVAYCRSGMRSGQAVTFLKGQGCEQVYNGGGIMDLMAAV